MTRVEGLEEVKLALKLARPQETGGIEDWSLQWFSCAVTSGFL